MAEDHPAVPSAAELFAELSPLSHAERVRAVFRDPRFHRGDLCRLLLLESRKAVFRDGSLGVDWADLAVRIAGRLGPEAADPALAALLAEALATLGNAYRVIGELRVAEECFLSADLRLDHPGVATPPLVALVRGLEASLRLAQRRLPEAREDVRLALEVAAGAGDREQSGKLLVKEAKIVEEEGDLPAAARLLHEAVEAIDPEADPELYRIARFNLLGILLHQERFAEAERLFAEVAPLFAEEPADSTHRLRLRWSEGLIARGFHRLDEAEEALREVQAELVRRQMGYEAALVAIDLGMIYLETGEVNPLRRLAADLLPIFAAKDLSKEAFAGLLLYQDACKSARLTARLARELALFIREDRRRPHSLKMTFRGGEEIEGRPPFDML